jgi:uncharacterized membrane protein
MQDWKIKISVLWLIAAVAYATHPIIAYLEPGFLATYIATGTIRGYQIGHVDLLIIASLVLVPLVMAFLSLTLKDSVNRWANTVVAGVYAFVFITNVYDALTVPSYGGALMIFAAFVASVLIVWYAWPSKQSKENKP